MAKDLHLKLFEATDFMGIDSTNPIVINFDKARKGANVVKLTGDQGLGKTSTMTALMYLMGAAFNIDAKNFKNLTDDTIDLNLNFDYDGDSYNVTASGSAGRITLKKFLDKEGKFTSVSEPKTVLRNIFGNLGVSPMFLAELSGKKQIQWFKDTFGDNPRINKQEEELVKKIDDLFGKRRDVNRDIKNLKGALEVEPLYQNYEKSQAKFKDAPSAKKEKESFDALSEKNAEYTKSKDSVARFVSDLALKKNEIADLELRLAAAKKSASDIDKRIDAGKKWLQENKNVPAQFEAANEAWINLSKTLAEYDKWKGVLKKEKELTDMQDDSQRADGWLDKLRLDLLELTQKYLPKIKGLAIKVKTSLDDDDEGIYYEGKTLAQLSESERWGLFCQIYEAKGVQFVFCENVNSLGSDAVAILNKLVKEGAQIFATEMDRKKDTMEITFETKIV
jgi:hypothetical protein